MSWEHDCGEWGGALNLGDREWLGLLTRTAGRTFISPLALTNGPEHNRGVREVCQGRIPKGSSEERMVSIRASREIQVLSSGNPCPGPHARSTESVSRQTGRSISLQIMVINSYLPESWWITLIYLHFPLCKTIPVSLHKSAFSKWMEGG